MKKYLKLVKWRYLLGYLCLFIATGADISFPIVTASIVDDVIVGGRTELIWEKLIILTLIGLTRAWSQYVKEYNCDMAGCIIAETLRKDMMGHIHTLSKEFFDKNNTGELMARVKDDAGKIWDLFGFVGMLFFEATVYLIGVIICMFVMNWKISLATLSLMPILAVIVMRLSKKLDNIYGRISEANAALTDVAEENISGVRTVKAFAREEEEIRKFSEKNDDFYKLNKELEETMAKTDPFITLIPRLMQGIALAFGGYMVIKEEITYGTLVAMIQYVCCVVWPIENMGWMTSLLSQGLVSLKKTKLVTNAKAEIVGTEKYVDEDLKGSLSFDNVSFDYSGKRVLDGISFNLEPGKTLGIMGATGSGKSTIVNLIQRFYDPAEGCVKIAGEDIRGISLKAVHGFSSLVTQEVFLFSDTIESNVSLGRKKYMNNGNVRYCLDKAHASEFVGRLSEGEATVIGERGIGLSGGQKQRISLARAFAKPAQVLILDDATSALDMETEREIQKELKEKKNLSKIIIAHRISSVKDADEIIILSDGKVAERGKHLELMELNGLYRSTYEAQYGDVKNAVRLTEGR